MTGPTSNEHTPADAAWRRPAVLAAAVAAVAVLVAIGYLLTRSDDTAAEDAAARSEQSSTSSSVATGDDTQANADEPAPNREDPAADPTTSPDEPSGDEQPAVDEVAGLSTAFAPDGEVAVCAEAKRRLAVYSDIARSTEPTGLTGLRLSLEEFEANLYTAAEEHDWGDQIIGNLSNTRRLWATSASAGEAKDDAAANDAAAQALKSLDAAIAVDCPT